MKTELKTVIIKLPGIKAISRNQTHGHWYKYQNCLREAEEWMATFGKRYEHHFTEPVNVWIDAYYDDRGRKRAADTPNIDDKIFTDILVRWKQRSKSKSIERPVWFIEDDSPKYLNLVIKHSIPSDHYEVVIKIGEAFDQIL